MSTRPPRQRPDTHSPLAQPPLVAHPESLVPTPTQAPRADPPRPARVKRSVQLDPDVADQFDDVVLSMHAQHRIPKGQVVDALLRVAFKHLDEISPTS